MFNWLDKLVKRKKICETALANTNPHSFSLSSEVNYANHHLLTSIRIVYAPTHTSVEKNYADPPQKE